MELDALLDLQGKGRRVGLLSRSCQFWPNRQVRCESKHAVVGATGCPLRPVGRLDVRVQAYRVAVHRDTEFASALANGLSRGRGNGRARAAASGRRGGDLRDIVVIAAADHCKS